MKRSDELSAQLSAQTECTAQLQEELNRITELIRELEIARSSFRLEKAISREREQQLAQELQIALRREEDDVPIEIIQPYLDTMNKLGVAAKLFPFQREDLAYQFGRYHYKDKYKGVLNANATGLGKTAETCVFIKVLQEMQNANV